MVKDFLSAQAKGATPTGDGRRSLQRPAGYALATAACLLLVRPAGAVEIGTLDVGVSGRAHLSADHLDNGAESSQFLSTNSSRLRVTAEQEIDDGLRAEAKYEVRVRLDSGDTNNDSDGLFEQSRESYLGVAGDFGVVRAGRITAPMMVAMDRFQMFGDQVGDAGNFLGGGGAVARYGNTIAYSSSDWWTPADPVRLTAAVVPESGPGNDPGMLLGLDYEEGPLFAGLSANFWGQDAEVLDRNEEDMSAVQGFLSYSAGPSRFIAAAQMTRNRDGEDGADDNVLLIGASHEVVDDTVVKVQGMQYLADEDDSDSSMLAAGVDYFFTDRFRVYGAAAMTTNDDGASESPWGWGHTDRSSPNPGDKLAVADGEDATALSVGARFDF